MKVADAGFSARPWVGLKLWRRAARPRATAATGEERHCRCERDDARVVATDHFSHLYALS